MELKFAQLNNPTRSETSQGSRVIVPTERIETSVENPTNTTIEANTIFLVVGAVVLLSVAVFFAAMLIRRPEPKANILPDIPDIDPNKIKTQTFTKK